VRQDRLISEHLAAIRCASEGATLATAPGKLTKGEVSMVHDAWKAENDAFLSTVAQDLRTLADAIEDTGDISFALASVMCSGLLVDRLTKRVLISAPGLEEHNTYSRSRDGIKVYDKDGNLLKLIPYSSLS